MSEPIAQQTVGAFLDALASGAPAPAGGSAAALSGAMAAGLISMACELTIGVRQFAQYEDELRGIQDRAEGLRHELQALAQEEPEVFARLAAAYKLPRTTDADAATRLAAIQRMTRRSADVPLRVAQAAAALLPLCTSLASMCSRVVVADVGAAAALARASVQAAVLRVESQLISLEDQASARESRAMLEDLTVGLAEEAGGVIALVRGRINGA